MYFDTEYDAVNKIWSGPERTDELKVDYGVDYEKSIGEIVYEKMSKNADRICQISDTDNVKITHGDALKYSISIAKYLRSLDLDHRHTVGIMAPNSNIVLSLVVGCWLNATPFHPINPRNNKDYISHLFGISRPNVIFCEAADYKQLILACAEINLKPQIYTIDAKVEGVPKVDRLFGEFPPSMDFKPTKLVNGPSQTSVLLCTSGTTGFPKCMHMSNEHILSEFRPIDSENVVFSFSNISWISGTALILITVLSGCTRIITTEPSLPELTFDLIEKHKITQIMTSPSQLAQAVKCFPNKTRDISSIQTFNSGGGIISVAIVRQACEMLSENGFLSTIYGATEWGSTTINVNFDKPKSAGLLLPGYSVSLIDDEGKRLGPNEVGELLVNNGRKWNGYVGNSVETAAVRDADGWFHTGDLGYFDEDGWLYIVDRKKDLLKYRGEQYMPSEIERVIAELDDVIEVCVFGVHDDIDMDRATAAVILKNKSQLSAEKIKRYVADNLPVRMHLHGGVYLMADLPRTSTGKVIRRETRDMIVKMKMREGGDFVNKVYSKL